MELSNEQIRILRTFYKHNEIAPIDFCKHGIDKISKAFHSLVGTYIDGPYYISPSNRPLQTLPYKINERGKAFIETIDTQKKTLFWSNFRSWFAFGLSIISFIFSLALK